VQGTLEGTSSTGTIATAQGCGRVVVPDLTGKQRYVLTCGCRFRDRKRGKNQKKRTSEAARVDRGKKNHSSRKQRRRREERAILRSMRNQGASLRFDREAGGDKKGGGGGGRGGERAGVPNADGGPHRGKRFLGYGAYEWGEWGAKSLLGRKGVI